MRCACVGRSTSVASYHARTSFGLIARELPGPERRHQVVVQDRLVVLAGAGLDRSAGDLPVGQPAGRVGAERDLFLGVVVGGVPAVLVDLAAYRDDVRLGVDAGVERVRGAVWMPSGPV